MLFLRSSLIVLFMLHSPVHAGDEDMNPTAYQIFDPVTGYMVPMENSPGQQHSQTAGTGPDQSGTASSTTGQSPVSGQAQTQDPAPEALWIYLVAGVLLMGGLAAWLRNKGRFNNDKPE